MKPLPFRLKIALLSAAISGAVLLAFGVAAWHLVAGQKLEAVDTEIRSLGARHPGWIAGRGNYQRLDDALAFIFGDAHEEEIILMVKGVDGRVLHTSPGWPSDLDPAKLDCTLADDPNAVVVGAAGGSGAGPEFGRGRGGLGRGLGPGAGGMTATFTKVPRFQTVHTTRGEWRLGMLGTADTTLVIGLNYDRARTELNRLRGAFMLAFAVALCLVGLAGWVVAGRALRPMKTIAETAERVTASGLDQRIPPSEEDPEIARVIQVLNRMMDRLEASFRQATRFSADASHELKTPLAIMQGELENALQAAAPGSAEQQLFTNLLEEVQRLKGITRSLLLLAQADAGQLNLTLEPVNLAAELDSMLEDARVLAADSRLTFDVQVQPQLQLSADRALLHTALFNLITNAIKYNQPDGKIAVTAARAGEHIVLSIANTGPGIPPEDQRRVFDRFYRINRAGSGVEGIGLGLSLAREIIRAHGGELALKESPPGWTVFAATLPE